MCQVPKEWQYDEVFETQDMGCGDFLLSLKRFFRTLAPGACVMLATRDPGSRLEVAAWCRLTGHHLLEQDHPYYLLKKKTDKPKED